MLLFFLLSLIYLHMLLWWNSSEKKIRKLANLLYEQCIKYALKLEISIF